MLVKRFAAIHSIHFVLEVESLYLNQEEKR